MADAGILLEELWGCVGVGTRSIVLFEAVGLCELDGKDLELNSRDVRVWTGTLEVEVVELWFA